MKPRNDKILIIGIVLLTAITLGVIMTYQNNYRETQDTLTISTTTSLYDTGLLSLSV